MWLESTLIVVDRRVLGSCPLFLDFVESKLDPSASVRTASHHVQLAIDILALGGEKAKQISCSYLTADPWRALFDIIAFCFRVALYGVTGTIGGNEQSHLRCLPSKYGGCGNFNWRNLLVSTLEDNAYLSHLTIMQYTHIQFPGFPFLQPICAALI